MAANRDRLAAVLAYQAEKRRRLAEYVPTIDQTEPVRTSSAGLGTNLENLSSGIGQGIVNQLEGVKSLVTDPVGTAKAAYEGVKGVVRNPAVLAEALRQTGQKAMSGPYGAGEVIGEMVSPMRGKPPVMQEIDVYHGSPHRFEEFDASKIGTGEGAQAYGHGIYLAESPAVAKEYQRLLSDKISAGNTVLVDKNKVIGSTGDSYIDSLLLSERGDLDAAIKGLQQEIDRARANYPHAVPRHEKAMQDLLALRGKIKVEQGGNFYTADLPDEMVDRMLDWDKPLSEQRELATPILKELGYLRPNDDGPRQFAQAVKALDMEYGGFGESGANGMALFKAIYRGLEQGKPKVIDFAKRMNLGDQAMFMEASPLASEVMKRMGIPGIRYLDAGSRGQGGSGTRNFVVFPGEEKKVKILKRE